MSLADDLHTLDGLRQRGAISEDEFRRAKSKLLDAPAHAPMGALQAGINGLGRSRRDRWLGGVCGGIALSTGVAAWFWRLLFVLLLTCAGTGLVLYALAWLLLPQRDDWPALPAPEPRAAG